MNSILHIIFGEFRDDDEDLEIPCVGRNPRKLSHLRRERPAVEAPTGDARGTE